MSARRTMARRLARLPARPIESRLTFVPKTGTIFKGRACGPTRGLLDSLTPETVWALLGFDDPDRVAAIDGDTFLPLTRADIEATRENMMQLGHAAQADWATRSILSPEQRAALDEGLASARRGEISYLGDFSKYAEDEGEP